MHCRSLYIPLLVLIYIPLYSQNLFYIQNSGQWDDDVLFLSRTGNLNVWITRYGMVYDYYKIAEAEITDEFTSSTIYGQVVKISLQNVNSEINQIGNNPRSGYYNFFIGNDPERWRQNIRLFNDITIEDIYDGIDIQYYFADGFIRYDYHIKPGADVNQIRMQIQGDEGITVNNRGELVIMTSLGELKHGDLYVYQFEDGIEKEVDCKFKIFENGDIGFNVGKHNPAEKLIIDPIVYSTLLGGSSYDTGMSVVVDENGSAFITGHTQSSDFPTTQGAYQTENNLDAYVTKFTPDGSDVVYSTFIGGSNIDRSQSIAIDNDGNAYIVGFTPSEDFPTTQNALQPDYPEYTDPDWPWHTGFVTKLNNDGSELVYSTYLGGSLPDALFDIAVDDEGNAYIVGNSQSHNYPVTPGAFKTDFIGSVHSNIVITKLNREGSGLIYSTYMGGSGSEWGNGIALDSLGNAYITGETWSSDFIITPNAFQTDGTGINAYISKLNYDGSDLFYSTYLGGSAIDRARSIAIDHKGNAYVTGITQSSDFPVTKNAFQAEHGDGLRDVFVAKMNPDGSELMYSTFLGGEKDDRGNSIVIRDQYAYVTGETRSNGFPTTPGTFQNNLQGPASAFLTIFNREGSDLVFSTFFGGGGYDEGSSIALHNDGCIYIAGTSGSSIVPTTPNAFQHPDIYGPPSGHSGFVAVFMEKERPDPVTLMGPDNGIIDQQLNISLHWEPLENATIYHIKVTDEINFEEPLFESTQLTEPFFELTDLDLDTEYFWRVRASNNGWVGEWSDVWSFTTKTTTYTERYPENIPSDFRLYQNSPNPFNPVTIIRYDVQKRSYVTLMVYNLLGQNVTQLVDQEKEAGYHEITFNASHLPSGLYIYRLQAGEYVESRKMLLLK